MMSFEELMRRLQAWRDEDHEDKLVLTRHEVIMLIEGVKTLLVAAELDDD